MSLGAQANLFFFKKPVVDLMAVRNGLADELTEKNALPSSLNLGEENYKLEYSTNAKLQRFIRRLLRRYASDFSSIVVIDNNTGEIIGLMDYNRKKKKIGYSLSFSATHPSASLFKIVSAAQMIENSDLRLNSRFSFNGKSTTLYKYQLKGKKNKWTRYQSFRNAFARSNNVIFGKAVLKHGSDLELYKMANKFGFNESLMDEAPIGSSYVTVAKNDYNLAEIASGFNRSTYMSPIHAALLPLVMANEGELIFPRLIQSIKNSDGEIVWRAKKKGRKIIEKSTAASITNMMSGTVKFGTARRGFSQLKKSLRSGLSLGGKTGSITGGVPYGKRDWFVAFARPKNNTEDKGISLCVMSVNKKIWRAKSTRLAKEIIEYYYSKIFPLI